MINYYFLAGLESAGKCLSLIVPFASAGCNQLSPGILLCCSLVVLSNSLKMLCQHTDMENLKGAMACVD